MEQRAWDLIPIVLGIFGIGLIATSGIQKRSEF